MSKITLTSNAKHWGIALKHVESTLTGAALTRGMPHSLITWFPFWDEKTWRFCIDQQSTQLHIKGNIRDEKVEVLENRTSKYQLTTYGDAIFDRFKNSFSQSQ